MHLREQPCDVQIRDTYIAQELETNGYVVFPGLTAAMVANLYDTVYSNAKAFDSTRINFNTSYDMSGPIRSRAFEESKQAFAPVLDRHFGNYEIIAGMLFVKRPSAHSDGQVGLHFDPSLLPDESRQKHLNVWSPLVDVGETNGALWLIPRSHKVFAPVHAATIPRPFSKIADTVLKYGKCIRMNAGDVLVFDNRIPHYSLQNLSDADRPAMVLSFVPLEAEFVSLFKSEDPQSSIEVYRQPRSWYRDTDWIAASERPKTGEFIGHLKYEPRFLGGQEFIDLIEARRPAIQYSFELKT